MPVGFRMPDEHDLTEEVLRDLPLSVRSTVEQAIARRRAESALGAEAREMIREIRDVVVTLQERTARMESAQNEQRTLYWPALERRIQTVEDRALAVEKTAEGRADEIEAKIDKMGDDLRSELRAMREARGVVYDAASAACRAVVELTRVLLDRPVALGILAVFVLIGIGLGTVAGGGQLASAWGNWTFKVDTRENREAVPADIDDGAVPVPPVNQP